MIINKLVMGMEIIIDVEGPILHYKVFEETCEDESDNGYLINVIYDAGVSVIRRRDKKLLLFVNKKLAYEFVEELKKELWKKNLYTRY